MTSISMQYQRLSTLSMITSIRSVSSAVVAKWSPTTCDANSASPRDRTPTDPAPDPAPSDESFETTTNSTSLLFSSLEPFPFLGPLSLSGISIAVFCVVLQRQQSTLLLLTTRRLPSRMPSEPLTSLPSPWLHHRLPQHRPASGEGSTGLTAPAMLTASEVGARGLLSSSSRIVTTRTVGSFLAAGFLSQASRLGGRWKYRLLGWRLCVWWLRGCRPWVGGVGGVELRGVEVFVQEVGDNGEH